MKKSLIALAALTLIAGTAAAQSSVTVYGLVDAGIARETGGTLGSVTKLATGVKNGNRLGFKGTEDLGAGLKANFQLEAGFDLDTGVGRQGALFGRQAYVGLSGNFGAVNLGRQYNLLFIAMDSIDPFGTGLSGATSNLMNPGVVRVNNAVTYSTPTMSGFALNTMYALGEVAGNTSAARTFGLSGTYANGPVAAVLAYDNINGNPTTTNTKLTLLGGTFDFGVAKAHIGYETEKGEGTSLADFRDLMVGVTVPFGASTVMASYIKKDDRLNAAQTGGKQYAIGYTYALSKRTLVYTSYARINNDNFGANYVSDASSGGITAPNTQIVGGNSSGFAVGMNHKF